MRTKHYFLVMLMVLLALLFSMRYVSAETLLHARVSHESGDALVRGGDDADWSYLTANSIVLPGDTVWVDNGGVLEIEMSGGSFLRVADGSKAEIEQLPPNASVNAWVGSFYVQRLRRSSGSFQVRTPACAIEVEKDTEVRTDVIATGGTTVSVRWGRVMVRTEGKVPVQVRKGERVFVDAGLLPSKPIRFDRTVEDAFDTWNRERAKLLALGTQAAPVPSSSSSTPIGYHDLAAHGEWTYVDDRPYWRPTTVVEYVPYRQGYWTYAPSYGHVWVGHHPFSYVTSHYGRWTHHPRHGWMWCYDDVWSPAWVVSYRHGSNLVWCPLDPWDRPCVYGSATFAVGDVLISVGATSYCSTSDLYLGPCAVYACEPAVVVGVPTHEINIWNIYAGSTPHRPIGPTSPLLVRDYAPRRVIRGPDTHGTARLAATARVSRLERSAGRSEFTTVRVVGSGGHRTSRSEVHRIARPRVASISEGTRASTAAAVHEAEHARSRGSRSVRSITARSSGASSLRGSATTRTSTTSTRSTRSVPASSTRTTTSRGTPSRGTTTPSAPRSSSTSRSARSAMVTPGSSISRASGRSTISTRRTVTPSDTSRGSTARVTTPTRTSTRTTSIRGNSIPSRVTAPTRATVSSPSRSSRSSASVSSPRQTVSVPSTSSRSTSASRSTTRSSTSSRTPSRSSSSSSSRSSRSGSTPTRSSSSSRSSTPTRSMTPSAPSRSSSSSRSSRSVSTPSRSSSSSRSSTPTRSMTPSAPSRSSRSVSTPSRSSSSSRSSTPSSSSRSSSSRSGRR